MEKAVSRLADFVELNMRSLRICPLARREPTAQQAVIAADTLAIEVERHLHSLEVEQVMELGAEVERAKLPRTWRRAPIMLQV